MNDNLSAGGYAFGEDRPVEPALDDIAKAARELKDFEGHEPVVRAKERRNDRHAVTAAARRGRA